MNINKYSSSKHDRSSGIEENSSSEFEQADRDQFRTFEEYNEEDYTVENFEEVLIEEQDASKWSKVDRSNPNSVGLIGDLQDKKAAKLEKAFNFNFRTNDPKAKENKVRFEKPQNYPHGFHDGEDALHKFEKQKERVPLRNTSNDREVTKRMNRYNSQEDIMSASLKRQLSSKNFKSPLTRGRDRSNSTSQKRYKLSSFTQEVGKPFNDLQNTSLSRNQRK